MFVQGDRQAVHLPMMAHVTFIFGGEKNRWRSNEYLNMYLILRDFAQTFIDGQLDQSYLWDTDNLLAIEMGDSQQLLLYKILLKYPGILDWV